MRPLGFSGAPSLLIDAGSGATLRAGVSVSVTVLDRASPGLYRILAGGEVLLARSEVQLEAGAVLKARVEKNAAFSGLLLRLEPQPRPQGQAASGLDSLLSRLQMPSDAAARLAASALLAEGLAPTQASILRVKRAIAVLAPSSSRDGGEEGSTEARLAARMEAKGLEVTPDALASLLSASDGGYGSGRHGGQGRGDDEDGGKPGQGDGTSEGEGTASVAEASDVGCAPGGWPSGEPRVESLPGDELSRRLGAFLRGLCMRTAEAAGGGDGAALGLYNHARAESGGRVIVPFRFSLDSVAFTGSFHILLPYIVGGPGRLEARFRAGREGSDASGSEVREATEWRFDLSFGSGGTRLSFHRPMAISGQARADKAVEDLFAELTKALSDSGCPVTMAGTLAEADEGEGVDVDA
jgi:hypothetical protein